MAHRYFFILGNTPILSSAEISAVLARRDISAHWVSSSEEVIALETEKFFNPKVLLATLGGTVKMGRMLPPNKTTEQWVLDRKTDGRLVVGVSVYKAAVGVANAKCADTLHAVRGEVLAVKRALKKEGQSPLTKQGVVTGRALRLVGGRERVLSSVALVTEHILERGGELVAFVSHKGVELGETLAVQAFHEYRHRDMGRPGRDARRGMLPPKVAQMMVNLGGVKEGGVIYDPFCGSGTVLSEAALLGYRVIGSDIAEDAVDDAKRNFQFLISNFQTNYQLPITNYQFFISDARRLEDHLPKHSIDAIVTEPYLGPPLTGREEPEQLAKIRQEVAGLVTDAFKSFRDVLRPGGRVVIVFPVLGGELLPIDGIQKLGWSLTPVIARSEATPARRSLGEGGKQSLTSRNTILYSRADQHLSREITIWTRV